MFITSRILRLYGRFHAKRIGKNILKFWGLKLGHPLTADDAAILKEIFCNRIYGDNFPFYQNVNILDIGAHKGFFSLFALLNTNVNSKIIAIEPAEQNYQLLQKNIQINNAKNILTLQKGIAKSRGRLNLVLTDEPNHSIYENYTAIIKKKVKKLVEIETITIADILLDFHLNKIDFVKMDCEGAEYEAVFSTPPQVLRQIKTFSIEFHDLKDSHLNSYKLVQYLKENGFFIIRYDLLHTVANVNTGHLVAVR
jgi:FkbM family methyltransferase